MRAGRKSLRGVLCVGIAYLLGLLRLRFRFDLER